MLSLTCNEKLTNRIGQKKKMYQVGFDRVSGLMLNGKTFDDILNTSAKSFKNLGTF
jgi:hypothetical protein